MDKYYRHFKGGLYKFISQAKDSETQEDVVVYQALYGEKQMWVRPAKMFFEKIERDGQMMDRFEEIDIDDIPIAMSQKYHFPDIEYSNQKLPLTLGEFSESVQSMITLLQNRHIVHQGFFQGLKSDDDLEREALRRIQEYKPGDDLEDIFHLIQTWGGRSGRGIYVRGNGFDWYVIEPAYQELVDACLSIRSVTENNLSFLVSAVERFNKSVRHMGVSFITKHTRFWLHKSLGEHNALPIYDSVMARNLMGKDDARIIDLEEYWRVMCRMAQDLQIGLVPLERQVFRCFSRITYKGFTFKYYHGEEQNPFADKDKNAAMWWSGEKLFYDTISREDGDGFVNNIKKSYEKALTYNDTSDIHKDPSLSKKDHILLFYLDMWHGKWFPYDDFNVINQY